MEKIIALTLNPTIDKSADVKNVIPERKLRCESPSFEPGGGAVNVARAIRKLGGDSLLITMKGGPHGELLTKLIEAEGIRYRCIETEAWTRENLTVYEQSTGLQYRFVMPGPALKEREWREMLDMMAQDGIEATYLVASGSIPPGAPDDFFARLADVVRPKGTRLIVDSSGQALCRALDAGVFLIKPNFNELEFIAGHPIGPEEQEKVARRIVESGGSEVVVVSLGGAGALLVSRDVTERVRAPTVPIKSKVGAGDSMVGAITLSLSRGSSIADALRFGVAAGASAVMTPGTELCRRDDTERLYARMKA